MSDEDALSYINSAIDYILNDTLDYEEAKKYSSHCHTTFGIYVALKEALEKQIPKKPINGQWGICCPNCGDTWNQNEYGSSMKYCWECGQAIDWSDSDE